MYIYICIHIYIYTYIHPHVYAHTYTHVYTYIYGHIYTDEENLRVRSSPALCTGPGNIDSKIWTGKYRLMNILYVYQVMQHILVALLHDFTYEEMVAIFMMNVNLLCLYPMM